MGNLLTDPSVPGSQRRLRRIVEVLGCEAMVFTLVVACGEATVHWPTLVAVELLALFWLGLLGFARTYLEAGRIEWAVSGLCYGLLATVAARLAAWPLARPAVGVEAVVALVLAFIYLSRRWLLPVVACVGVLVAALALPGRPIASIPTLHFPAWLLSLATAHSYTTSVLLVLGALWDYRQRWRSLLHHNQRALSQAEGGAEQNRRLQALTAAMVRPMSVAELLTVAVEQRTSLLRATTAWAHLVDEHGALQLEASHGVREHGAPLGEAMLQLSSPVLAAQQLGQPVWLENRQALALAYGQLAAHAGAQGVGALVALPLLLEDQPLGVMTLAFAEPMRWSRSERRLLSTAASLLAQAVERSRLHEAEVLAHARQQHLAADLQRALRVREEFLMVAGHELRTPLAALQLQLQSMHRRMGDAAEVLQPWRHKIGRAVDHTLRLGHLVDTLLEVSQFSGGPLRLHRERLDLADLLQESVDLVHEPATRSGSVLRIQAEASLEGLWDRRRLEQVLVNLLGNAIKYGEGRPVEVTLRELGDDAVLSVADQGIGIVPADLDRIFGKFERAVSERHYGGMGVGLWVTRQIIEAHGGHIHVTSAAGRGSVFTVTLPRWETGAVEAPFGRLPREQVAHD